MNTQTEDKLASAKSQGQAQFDSIKEMVEALEGWEKAATAEGWDGPHKDQYGATYFKCDDDSTYACASWRKLCEAHDIEPERDDDAEQAIHEDALEVLVRNGWHTVGDTSNGDADEYQILLCTGGPACRIVGTLRDGEPDTAVMEVQDWFQPWTAMRPQVGPDDYNAEPIMLTYARCFYFGE